MQSSCLLLIQLALNSSFLLTTWINMARVIMPYFCIVRPKGSTIFSFIKLWKNGSTIMSKILNIISMLLKMEVPQAFMTWRNYWKSSRWYKMAHLPFKMGSRLAPKASLSYYKVQSILDATICQVNISLWSNLSSPTEIKMIWKK